MLCRISAELGKTGNWQNFRQDRNTMVQTDEKLTETEILAEVQRGKGGGGGR